MNGSEMQNTVSKNADDNSKQIVAMEKKSTKAKSKNKSSSKRIKPLRVAYDCSQLLENSDGQSNKIYTAKVINKEYPEGLIASIALDDDNQQHFLVPKLELLPGDINDDDEIKVYVDEFITSGEKDVQKMPRASLAKASYLTQIEQFHHHFQIKAPIAGCVISKVKDGYSVAIGIESVEDVENGLGFRAFLPHSRSCASKFESADIPLNTILDFVIIDFQPQNGNIIVSRREIIRQKNKAEEASFFEKIKEGDVVEGVIKSIVSYGAFIDLGASDGFIHISDFDWNKIPSIKEIVGIGDKVKTKIISINKETKKIKLSVKKLTEDPWITAKNKYFPGKEVEGEVVAVTDFGAFLKLNDGIEGLIHLSEVSWKRTKHPAHQFNIGQKIKAKVLKVDHNARKISLSTKALEKRPIQRIAEQFKPGFVLKTKIVSLRDFGVLVQLDEDILGLVRKNELSWTKRITHPSELFHEGQEVEVVILKFDMDRDRILCSIKQAQSDPWAQWRKKYCVGSKHKVKISRILQSGVECCLENDLLAFCPLKELSERPVLRAQEVAKVGDEINVEVTSCDPSQQRVVVSCRKNADSETKQAYRDYMEKERQRGSKSTLGDIFASAIKKDK